MTTDWRDWLLFAIIMAACCLGCGYDIEILPPDPVFGTCSSPSGETATASPPTVDPKGLWIVGLPVAATLEACRMWSWTGLTCDLSASPENAWITLTAETEPDCAPDPASGWVSLGSGPWRSVSIHLSCWKGHVETDADMRAHYIAAVAHEIGHSLGLEHVEDKDAIMHWFMRYQRALNDTDRAEFTRVWGDLSPP